MSRPSFGTDRTPVALAPRPASRGWIALCLAVGSAALALALGAALAERARGASPRLAEEVLAPRLDASGSRSAP